MKCKDRPKIAFNDDCSEHEPMEGSLHLGNDDDDLVDVVVESEYGPPTDSSVGYPEYAEEAFGSQA